MLDELVVGAGPAGPGLRSRPSSIRTRGSRATGIATAGSCSRMFFDRGAKASPRVTEAVLLVTLLLTASAVAVFRVRTVATEVDPRLAGAFLWFFLELFLLRVLGQIVVVLRAPCWLPPMEQWNLTPYRLLLPTQILFLAAMGWIATDLTRGAGFLARPNSVLGFSLIGFSYVYVGVMVIRYAIRMGRRPEQRWSGGAIPIVFHFVLAAFVHTLGNYHASY